MTEIGSELMLRHIPFIHCFNMRVILILIFMIIKENIRNHRKITEKLRGIPTKLLISQLLIATEYQTWLRNNAKT